MKKLDDLKGLKGVQVLTKKEQQTVNGAGLCFNGKYWYKCVPEWPL